MLYKSIIILAVLTVFISGHRQSLEELLKRATDDIVDSRHEPLSNIEEVSSLAASVDNPEVQSLESPLGEKNKLQTKVEEITGEAMIERGEKVGNSNTVPLVARNLVKRATYSIVEHVVPDGNLKNLIVSLHNELRRNVTPPASDMLNMVWDSDVADYSAKMAECVENPFQHRIISYRAYMYGENIYMSLRSDANLEEKVKHGLMSWWKENKSFHFGSNRHWYFNTYSHYTQMAWAKSSKVGCGYALNCPFLGFTRTFLLVCNYSPPGNYVGQMPYTPVPSTRAKRARRSQLTAGSSRLTP